MRQRKTGVGSVMKYSDLFYSLRNEDGDRGTRDAMDRLAGRLVDLSQVALSVTCDKTMTAALLDGLSLLDTDGQPDLSELQAASERAAASRDSGGFSCFFRSRDIEPFDLEKAFAGNEGGIKALLFLGLSALAVRLLKLRDLKVKDKDLDDFVYRGLSEVAGTFPYNYMTDILRDLGMAGLRSMELLAQTSVGAVHGVTAPDAEGASACAVDSYGIELAVGGCGNLSLSCGSVKLQGTPAFRLLEKTALQSKKPEIGINLTSSSAALLALECSALGFRQINIGSYPNFITSDANRFLTETFGIRKF